jgi:hypothetical protein
MPRCDQEIYDNGELIAVLRADGKHTRTEDIDAWVEAVATEAKARLDWYQEGGYPQVLHLGDDASYARAIEAIKAHNGQHSLTVTRTLPRGYISAFRHDR